MIQQRIIYAEMDKSTEKKTRNKFIKIVHTERLKIYLLRQPSYRIQLTFAIYFMSDPGISDVSKESSQSWDTLFLIFDNS